MAKKLLKKAVKEYKRRRANPTPDPHKKYYNTGPDGKPRASGKKTKGAVTGKEMSGDMTAWDVAKSLLLGKHLTDNDATRIINKTKKRKAHAKKESRKGVRTRDHRKKK